jgi:hypothetical protein
MSLIDDIKARLSKYPNARYECTGSYISVFPSSDNGFTVELSVNHVSYTVSFNGWHEEFQKEDEALECFAFGLSDECRLRECRRGDFAYRWTVESKQNGNWVADSETGLFLFPFWKPKKVYYLQNNLLTSEQRSTG